MRSWPQPIQRWLVIAQRRAGALAENPARSFGYASGTAYAIPSFPMQHVWLAIILAVGPAEASAQAQPVGAIAALVGQGTVIHAAAVERAPAKVRDEIFVRDRIDTPEQSAIRVPMARRSTLSIRRPWH